MTAMANKKFSYRRDEAKFHWDQFLVPRSKCYEEVGHVGRVASLLRGSSNLI